MQFPKFLGWNRLLCTLSRIRPPCITMAQSRRWGIGAIVALVLSCVPVTYAQSPVELSFVDVTVDHWAMSHIEMLYGLGITGGCSNSPPRYCPGRSITRDQMAVFLVREAHGPEFVPPRATGNVFVDVPADHWAAAWIEQLFNDGITGGCGNLNFCPKAVVTRDQMAVFLLRAKEGIGYVPPAPTGGVFVDVSVGHWAAASIEELRRRKITFGCRVEYGQYETTRYYCPDDVVLRDQMAVFLMRAFPHPCGEPIARYCGPGGHGAAGPANSFRLGSNLTARLQLDPIVIESLIQYGSGFVDRDHNIVVPTRSPIEEYHGEPWRWVTGTLAADCSAIQWQFDGSGGGTATPAACEPY